MTCHPLWYVIMEEALALSPYDITLIHGLRGEYLQNALYDSGASRKRFPDSTHNSSKDPDVEHANFSDAVDFGPWVDGGVPWKDTHIFACIAGIIMSVAKRRGVKTRWGGDWDSDGKSRGDQKLMDWGHIEIIWS